MSAYNAFKACAPVAWSANLYITLVRGIPGTRRLHRCTLEALRLGKCNRTVMRWNTPAVRGMLQQLKRLVVVETEEMYKARMEKIANHKALRPPLVINHHAAPAADSVVVMIVLAIVENTMPLEQSRELIRSSLCNK
ncbi:hypothetical protein P3S68_017982 [Capsicum galapagoense]